MIKFLLSTTVACLLGSGVMAQNIQTDKTPKLTERHRSFFGKRHMAKDARSTTTLNKKTETKAPAFKLKNAPKAPRITDFKPLNYVPYDTILCTQQNHLVNGQTTKSKNFEYDEYGLYRMVTSNDEKGKEETRYTYQIGDFNFWTSRLIEARKDNGAWKGYEKEERAFNANKQMIARKIYQFDHETFQMYLDEQSEYDWNHKIVKPNEFNDNIIDTYYGATTHYVKYDWKGQIEEEERYEWYEPLQQYVETYYYGKLYHEKRITELKKYETVTKRYSIDYNYSTNQEEEYLSRIETKYYGNVTGYYNEEYGQDGSILNEDGRKKETLKHTPSYGITTIIEYEYGRNEANVDPASIKATNEENWTPTSKYCKKGYDENGKMVIGQDFETLEYYYDDETNEWELRSQHIGHWLNDQLLCEKTKRDAGDGDSEYTLYKEDGTVQRWIDYDPVRKCYSMEEEEEGTGYWITNYYNLQHELIQRVRTVDCTLGANVDPLKYTGVFYDPWYLGENLHEWKNGKWVPVTGTLDMYSDDERTKINTDAKGNVISIEFYDITDDDLVGTLNEKEIYEYKENEIRNYIISYENGVQVGVADTAYLKNLGNGNYEYYSIEYSSETNRSWGTLSFLYSDGLIKTTSSYCNKWEGPTYHCPYIVTVDEKTGITTTIKRGYDDATKQYYNVSKKEYLERPETDYRYAAEYIWNKERNGWEGTRYVVEERRDLSVPFKAIKYPAPYDDYSKYPEVPGEDTPQEQAAVGINRQNAEWSWRDDTSSEGRWSITYSDIVQVRPNGANVYDVRIIKRRGRDEDLSYLYRLELDEHQQVKKVMHNGYELLGYKKDPVTQIYERVEKYTCSDFEFTYNAQGFVTEKKELPYKFEGNQWVLSGDKIIDQYVFTNVKLTPTAVEEVQQGEEFKIAGREISAADNAVIHVYDLSGRKVASGKGNLTLPAAGLYIVNCNGKTVKVSCR